MGFNNENAMLRVGLPWMVFDIETVPMPDCGQYLTDPIEAPSNYKDPAKIAAYIEEKRRKQIDEAGLDFDLCEVVSIAWRHPDSQTFCQTRADFSEAEMVDTFWRVASTAFRENGVLVGFSCLNFDLLVLLRRALYLGLKAPAISLRKYENERVVDVSEALCFGRRDCLRSLGFYAKRFGIPHDDSIDGSQIAQLVAEGKWADVEAHNRADVDTTTALAQRCGLIYTPVVTDESMPVAI